jgi:acetyl/propionyl-CoA carboxylase alpha subunit/acetyl-CoA carboxylase carboxyltransferase component
MNPKALLVANRGEVAVRIARAAHDLGLETVAVFAEDDADALHVRRATRSRALAGSGPSAYLDAQQLIRIALEEQCEAVHPGYGFLSENAQFAASAEAAGVRFIGPAAEALTLLGDKARARQLAREHGVPVIAGTQGATTLAEAQAFMRSLPAGSEMMIKAIAGGGGRGMRAVATPDELPDAYARCRSEAAGAFGFDAVYVEQKLAQVRHVEIQVLGDGQGQVVALGERECSIQRRHQKLIEFAPSPFVSARTRQGLVDAALRMAGALAYRGLGTFEFLVDAKGDAFHFIEANPRLQVEHTVTEEVFGVDLVRAQIAVCRGATLGELGLDAAALPQPRGMAVQLRVNLESVTPEGAIRPSGGRLEVFDLPSGPGVRVDTCGYSGLRPSPAYDSLIAKLIVFSPHLDHAALVDRAARVLREFRISGAATNVPLLLALLADEKLRAGDFDTAYLDSALPRLAGIAIGMAAAEPAVARGTAEPGAPAAARQAPCPEGAVAVAAPMLGRLLRIEADMGDVVAEGATVAIVEAMKMEHTVHAPTGGRVLGLAAVAGDVVDEGSPLLFLEPSDVASAQADGTLDHDPDHIRADLAEANERHAWQQDARREKAVAARHAAGKRTARENVADLLDDGSFVEYGPLAVAGQRARRDLQQLREISPADGLVAGIGSVNAAQHGEQAARCMVLAYDYTVFAGTQGHYAHRKKDRMLELAERLRMPVVLFAEGGGGRPGDTDNIGGANPSNPSFWRFARLSGLVPTVGVVSGRCFAGNAALLGVCDVIIATSDASIGMGGPVMIECGGLGKVAPDDVGPMSFQAPNGVVDLVVPDEAAAVAAAKKYLSYFQGPVAAWRAHDQHRLRHAIPENRLRSYDVRHIIDTLADADSVLELRREFGLGVVTAFIRVEGRPIGVLASNSRHQAGAIDADDADKSAHFMQLCDAFDIPVLSLCDTPGFMVGPAAEKRALVRHAARMFVTAASLQAPMFVVVLRKGYGLGAMAIGGGSFQRASVFAVAWPTGEFGAMGLEGAVQLGYRNELAAIDDAEAREARYQELVNKLYEHGKAVNIAPFLSFDDVIDPADTRHWLSRGLKSLPPAVAREGKRRPAVDPW